MDLALNNLQKLICHKTQQTKPHKINLESIIHYLFMRDQVKADLTILQFQLRICLKYLSFFLAKPI